MKVTGVVLAAGRSSRMKLGNKLLLEFGGRTVLETVLLNTAASKVDEVIIVTGCERERVLETLTPHLDDRVRIVHNSGFERGRAESVRCALHALDDTVEAALFMVGDKPGVATSLIDRVLDRFRRERPAILHVNTPSGRGHPIVFAREVFPEFAAVEGDFCANDMLARYRDRTIALDDDRDQIDIDTEDDYRAALAQLAALNQNRPTAQGRTAS